DKGILSPGEQASVVASVTGWTWEKYTGWGILSDEAFKASQKFRVTCRWGDSSEPKAVAIRLYKNGMKIAEIARRLGFHRNTVSRWVKPP
ncbi:MAG: helix-turn-helix domain-containing protein, partial [Desulfofustis sp.]|nr:helix-turn-helix domain-containing protein [Desulfofustis sp.]